MKILEVHSSILHRRKCTVGIGGELLIELGDFFELFLDDFNNPVQYIRLDFLNFLTIDLTDDLVNFLQSLSKFGVEVVLNAVIGSK